MTQPQTMHKWSFTQPLNSLGVIPESNIDLFEYLIERCYRVESERDAYKDKSEILIEILKGSSEGSIYYSMTNARVGEE